MTLKSPHSDWRLSQVSVLDIRFVGLDQLLTRLWLRVLHDNRNLTPRIESLQVVQELAHLMERSPRFYGFDKQSVAETWLRADLVKTLKRQPNTFTVARPLHDRAVRLRNPREDGDSNASLVIYGWLHHCDPELLDALKSFLMVDIGTESIDLATFALGLLGSEQPEDAERPTDAEAPPAPLCQRHAAIFADDLRRLLAYRDVMPRADLVEHMRRLAGLHLALYLLKVFRIAVDAETSGGKRTPCDLLHEQDPSLPCPYQAELLVDCGEDARSAVARMAEAAWATEEELLSRYIRSHLSLRKLWEFAEQLKRRHPKEALPFETVDDIAAVEADAKRARIDAYFSNRFDELVTDAKGLKDAQKREAQEAEIRDMEAEYTALGMSPFRAYVALLAHYSERRWVTYHRYLLDSLFGKNSGDGMLRQPLGGRRRRRLSMAPGILETLTLIAVVGDSARGFVARPIRVDELIDRLSSRYGLVVGRPTLEFQADPAATAVLKDNVQRFKARLRETGLYTDLSDAFLAQQVKPRYLIGSSG